MSDKVEYIINEDLGTNGGKLLIKNVEELIEWIDIEFSYWEWIANKNDTDSSEINSARSRQFGTLNSLKNYSNQLAGSPQNQQRHVSDIQSQLATYKNKQTLHSSTPEAKATLQINKQVGLHEASVALLMATKQSVNLGDARNFHGAVIYSLYLQGYSKHTTTAVRNSLDELFSNVLDRNAKDTDESHLQREALETLIAEHKNLYQRNFDATAKAVRRSRTAAEKQRNIAKDRLEELEELYRKRISLLAPITYWKRKRRKHRIAGGIALTLFISYVGVSLFYLNSTLSTSQFGNINFWMNTNFSFLGIVGIAIGLFASVARIIYRLFLSQLHLGNDADERITMVETYLALDDQGHAKDEFMAALYDRLFAPASDGIVKDDFGPVSAVDAIFKAASKSK